MPSINQATGVNIGELFKSGTNGLDKDGTQIQDMMNKLTTNKDGSINQIELLQLQYAMGQYNAKLETVSSITKSMQDMLKSLAQRTG